MEKATKKGIQYVGVIQMADSLELLDHRAMFTTNEFVFMSLEEQRYVIEQLGYYFNNSNWRLNIPSHLLSEKERRQREQYKTDINFCFGKFKPGREK